MGKINVLGCFYRLVFTICFWLVGVSSVHADVYKCTTLNGKVNYQEVPCQTGTEKPLDNSEFRQRAEETRIKKEREANSARFLKPKEQNSESCFGNGWGMALAYMANWRNAAEVGLMSSQFMEQGCAREVGLTCYSDCRSGFTAGVRSVLKN